MRGAYSFELPEGLAKEDPRGDLFLSQEEVAQIVSEVQAAGYQAAIYAIGDRAIETVLNGLEAALAGGANTLRHRIDHNWMVRPEFLPRYGELGIVPSIWAGAASAGC